MIIIKSIKFITLKCVASFIAITLIFSKVALGYAHLPMSHVSLYPPKMQGWLCPGAPVLFSAPTSYTRASYLFAWKCPLPARFAHVHLKHQWSQPGARALILPPTSAVWPTIAHAVRRQGLFSKRLEFSVDMTDTP